VQGIVLAAGVGRRLRGPLGEPKGLIRVGGLQPLPWTVGLLARCGLSRVTVVVGHEGRRIERLLVDRFGGFVECRFNARYLETDTAASYVTGAECTTGPIVLTYADTMFSEALLERLLDHPATNALAVDPTRAASADMRVSTAAARVDAIRKDLPAGATSAESACLFKFGEEARAELVDACRERVDSDRKAWFETVLDGLLPTLPLAPVDCHGEEWCEIDSTADLPRATRFAQRLPS
jgi:choline kinase